MHVNIWIRKDNVDKWNNIPDKSNWVNTLLANSGDTSRYGAVRPTPAGPMVEVLSETLPPVETPLSQVANPQLVDLLPKLKAVCEHGAAKGFCRFSKCKFRS